MTDRQVVTALLQYMTDKYLNGSRDFKAVLAHFDIRTISRGEIGNPDFNFSGRDACYYVDVYSAEYPDGRRYAFDTRAEAAAFSQGVLSVRGHDHDAV